MKRPPSKNMSTLIGNIAVLALMTQYIGILPIGIETQPILAVIVVLMALPYYSRSDTLVTLALIVSSLLFLITSQYWGKSDMGLAFLALLKYYLPVFFCLSLFITKAVPSERFLKYIILALWALTLLYFFGLEDILVSIFQRYTVSQGSRGFSFLTPEQSYAAMMFVPLYFWLHYHQGNRISIQKLSILFFILLTKSAIGYVLLIFIVFFQVGFGLFLVMPIMIFVYIYVFQTESRLNDIIELLHNIDFSDILLSIVDLEPSGSNRLIVNFVAIYEGLISVTGYGLGAFTTIFPLVLVEQHHELISYHSVLSPLLYEISPVNPQSFFASIIFEMGIMGLLLLFVALFLSFLSCKKFDSKAISLFLIMIVFLFYQGQITSPTLPLLIFIFSLLSNLLPSSSVRGSIYHS